MPTPAVLALFGPTGVGKTGVALALAERMRARGADPVAVSADALQVYAGLETLTGAASEQEQERLEHRVVSCVAVTESFALEFYSQVIHIVSNVEGDLDPAHDALAALSAGFPAGTVSGAPKVRAMEIIDELEREKRGPYGGCIGYFGARGEMDTCIVLRTAIVKDGRMHVQAGAGIVHDSDPQAEQQECVNKARALFRAAEDAVSFASRARRGQ